MSGTVRERSSIKRLAFGVGIALGVIGTSAIAAHLATRGLDEHSGTPTGSYEAALARLALMQAQEDERVNPVCRTQLLTHGKKVTRVVVLVHGLTNCPQQYAALAQQFYQQGYNVLIPRMPRHGFADRMTNELKYLTAEELRDFSNEAVDIACGLGEQVIFAGLSLGGVVAAWVAQHRSEVSKAVLIAPAFTLGRFRATINTIIMDLLLTLPDVLTQYIVPFQDGPQQSYLGYSSRALGQMLRLGAAVEQSALKRKAAVQSILLITNAADTAVNNLVAWQLISSWRAKGLEQLEAYEFAREHGLIHDIIDPQQQQQQTALVYPILLYLISL